MKILRRDRRLFWAAILAPVLATAGGCHSNHVESTILNQTGGPVQLIEVDYPEASFGVNALPAGGVYHNSFQITGTGPLKIDYTAGGDHQFHATGPNVFEHEQGRLEIVLLPGGKVEFHPQLIPPS
jgi:hypothetical protein